MVEKGAVKECVLGFGVLYLKNKTQWFLKKGIQNFFLKHVTSERFRWPVAGVSRCDGKEAGRGSDRG